jgi:hypothetical protein
VAASQDLRCVRPDGIRVETQAQELQPWVPDYPNFPLAVALMERSTNLWPASCGTCITATESTPRLSPGVLAATRQALICSRDWLRYNIICLTHHRASFSDDLLCPAMGESGATQLLAD